MAASDAPTHKCGSLSIYFVFAVLLLGYVIQSSGSIINLFDSMVNSIHSTVIFVSRTFVGESGVNI